MTGEVSKVWCVGLRSFFISKPHALYHTKPCENLGHLIDKCIRTTYPTNCRVLRGCRQPLNYHRALSHCAGRKYESTAVSAKSTWKLRVEDCK